MIDGNVVDMTFLGSPFRDQHTIIRARLADVIERAGAGSGYDLCSSASRSRCVRIC